MDLKEKSNKKDRKSTKTYNKKNLVFYGMVDINPDKYIKSVFDLVNNIVNGKTIKCFDVRVTGNAALSEYVLLTNQTKEIDKSTNAVMIGPLSLLIEIYTRQAQTVIVALGF
jgi:hypothetical protein